VTSTANTVTINIRPNNLHDAYLTGFRIYADDGADGPWSVDTVLDTTQRTFTKYGLSPGLPYRFKYQVVSEVGASVFSDIETHYSAATPDGPTVYVTGTDQDSIYLAWTPGFHGGAPVTGWRVYGSKTGLTWPDGEWTTASAAMYTIGDPTVYSQRISCLPEFWNDVDVRGTAYDGYLYFKVSGVNAAGIGEASDAYRFRCSAPPVQPAIPQKVSGTASSITISYGPRPEDANSGAIYTGYKILYDDGYSGDYSEVKITQTSTTQYTIGGLTAGLQYRIRVRVLSEVGESPLSDPLLATIGADADPPSQVYYVSSQNCPEDDGRDVDCELTVGWDFPGSNGGAAIQSWYLYYAGTFAELMAKTADQRQQEIVAAASPPTATLLCRNVDGDGNQKYVYFRAAAVTPVGVGRYSGVSRIFCANRPDAPTVQDQDGTATSVTVTFREQNLYKAVLVGYKIYMSDGLGGRMTYRGMVEDTSQRYYTATGLITDRSYAIQVTVVTTAGESLPGSPAGGSVRSCGFPAKPSAPARGASTRNSVELIWQAPADNGCPMTSYEVYRSEDLGTTWVLQGAPLAYTTLRTTIAGLTPKVIYAWKVKACNARACTDSELAYMKAAGQPATITTLAQEVEASTAGAYSIALSWVAPDMEDGIPIGYKVYRNDGAGGDVSDHSDPTCGLDTRPAPQRCTVTGLQYGRWYTFQVAAINEVGEGPRSAEQQFRAAAVPATITTLANPEGNTFPSLTFTWGAPNSRGAAITNYDGQLERVTNVDAGPVLVEWNTATRGQDSTDLQVIFTAPDVAVGEQYRFRVRGYNEQGPAIASQWGWSDWSSTTPNAAGDSPVGWTLDKPNPPTAFGRASDLMPTGDPKATEITVGWVGVTAAADLGQDALENCQYEVYAGFSVDTMTPQGAKLDAATALAAPYPQTHYFTVGNLEPGQHVYFQVYTWNSAWRSLAAVTPPLDLIAASKPGKPTIKSAVSTAAGSVDIAWEIPTDDGGAPLLEYVLAYGVAPDDENFQTTVGPGETLVTWEINGFDAAAAETFHIRARTNAGYSEWDNFAYNTP